MNKIIHYCWFGGNPKSKTIEKCIESWKNFFPDWEIKEWNESNFDVRCNIYVSQAYDCKKWAFVSDYARFWALKNFGGIYFDTDVEVIRDFTPLLDAEAFSGFESEKFINPGLVLFCKEPNHPVISATCEYYEKARFLDENGERIRINVCGIFSKILEKFDFVSDGQLQNCGGMILYPKEYFNPFDDTTGLLHNTKNTYSIHWYDKSWMSTGRKLRNKCTRIIHRVFGSDIRQKLTGKTRS